MVSCSQIDITEVKLNLLDDPASQLLVDDELRVPLHHGHGIPLFLAVVAMVAVLVQVLVMVLVVVVVMAAAAIGIIVGLMLGGGSGGELGGGGVEAASR